MTDPVVWLNGAMLAQSSARMDPLSQGLLFGLGVYDTLRTVNGGHPLELERHHSRLSEGADRLRLAVPALPEVANAIAGLLTANRLRDARIRVTLTAGAFAGTQPTRDAPGNCLITAAGLAPVRPAARLVTSPWKRNPDSPLAGIKSTACAENILAQRFAAGAGADEALFLNTRGELCEGSFSNIFVAAHGEVTTPPLSSGCLPGITRECVIRLCTAQGIPLRECAIHPGSLSAQDTAREIFLTSSIRGIQPVESLNGVPLHAPGTITRRLMDHYAAWLDQAGK